MVAVTDDKLVMRDLSVYYGGFQALSSIDLSIPAGAATAVIGAAGRANQVYCVLSAA